MSLVVVSAHSCWPDDLYFSDAIHASFSTDWSGWFGLDGLGQQIFFPASATISAAKQHTYSVLAR